MVSFTLTESERAARTAARTFATTHLTSAKSTYTTLPTPESRFQSLKPIYAAAVRAGLIKAQIPSPVGGTSSSLVEAAILVEEFYAVEASASLTIFGTGLGLTPLCLAFRPELNEFLQPFLSQQGAPLASLVFSEPAGVVCFQSFLIWLFRGISGLCLFEGDMVIDEYRPIGSNPVRRAYRRRHIAMATSGC
jgi:alkylation response protein AidB-like acyl-CoA dehydrogenase